MIRQQAEVPVEPRETLEERIHAVEHRLLPQVVGDAMPRALISVWDKTGVDELARGLADLGWELVSSGGTASFLEEQGLDVTRVEEVTEAPEMLGGRVKTLHPRIHAGILARRDLPEDTATLAEHDIEPFDLVCVSLYPFTSVAGRRGATEAEVVEMIDVGGPSMLRAAAKNFAHVVAVSSPDQYDVVLDELRERGEVSLDTRRELAARGVRDDGRVRRGDRELVRRDGAVPRAADAHVPEGRRPLLRREPAPGCGLLRARTARGGICSRRSSSSAARSSRTTTSPTSRARAGSLREFALPAVVIVKHANPCGVAVAATIEEAWERALAADPVSAFGCVAVLNRPVVGRARRAHRRALRRGAARARLRRRRGRGAAREAGAAHPVATASAVRRRRASATSSACSAACSCRSATATSRTARRWRSSAASVTEAQWGDLLFAWRVCKHVASNAIVLAKDLQTIGIGAGQMSRVDAVRIAIEKAREHGHDLAGSCSRATPSSRSPTARSWRSTPA